MKCKHNTSNGITGRKYISSLPPLILFKKEDIKSSFLAFMLFRESTMTILSFDKDLSTSDLSTPLKFFSAGISIHIKKKIYQRIAFLFPKRFTCNSKASTTEGHQKKE